MACERRAVRRRVVFDCASDRGLLVACRGAAVRCAWLLGMCKQQCACAVHQLCVLACSILVSACQAGLAGYPQFQRCCKHTAYTCSPSSNVSYSVS
jgi:hypothetical protein